MNLSEIRAVYLPKDRTPIQDGKPDAVSRLQFTFDDGSSSTFSIQIGADYTRTVRHLRLIAERIEIMGDSRAR